ncbi:peptidoglycan-binding domain-containing protein [Aurantimonas sp. A2-1-M11]|uniref:peptidoglycan-binding domain-containing protein n=1 Tax=Aurantimonas sp. A2-1-M11 TaxID=3113712 RepID=UPI002F9597AE
MRVLVFVLGLATALTTVSQSGAAPRNAYSPELKRAIRVVVEACGHRLNAQEIIWDMDKWGADVVRSKRRELIAINIDKLTSGPEWMRRDTVQTQRFIAYYQCLEQNYTVMRARYDDPAYSPAETPFETLGRRKIQTVQRLLNDRGYDAGTPDGLMGPRTRGAIRAFQSAEGMAQTGDPDGALLAALREGGVRNSLAATYMEDPQSIVDEGSADALEAAVREASQSGEAAAAGEARSRPPGQSATDDRGRTVEMSGQCEEDMRRIEADIVRIAAQAEGGAMAMCEVHQARFEVLSNAAAALRMCPSLNTTGTLGAEFERAAAASKAALDGPCG